MHGNTINSLFHILGSTVCFILIKDSVLHSHGKTVFHCKLRRYLEFPIYQDLASEDLKGKKKI